MSRRVLSMLVKVSMSVIRTTVSIPADLKRHMDHAKGVNWSAVAVAAFRYKLGLKQPLTDLERLDALEIRVSELERRNI